MEKPKHLGVKHLAKAHPAGDCYYSNLLAWPKSSFGYFVVVTEKLE